MHVSVLYAAHSAFVSSARIDGWDLLFSAHCYYFFVASFKGDTTKGGPILVAYGDLFTVFLITIRLVLKRQGR
jgi:hypothetical protein